MPEDIAPAVIPLDPEIPVLRRQPAVFHGEDLDSPVPQPEPAGGLFTAVSGIT
jgi:hypothetical protein